MRQVNPRTIGKVLTFVAAVCLAFAQTAGATLEVEDSSGVKTMVTTLVMGSGLDFSLSGDRGTISGGPVGTDGNWTGDGTTTVLDANSTGYILTHSSGDFFATGFTAGSGDITLENSQTIDGGTNSSIFLGDNSDTLEIEFTGNDVQYTASDGGHIFVGVSGATGTIDFHARADTDDWAYFDTIADVPTLATAGSSNLAIIPDGGTVAITGILTVSGTSNLTGATTVTSIIIGDDTYDVVTDDEHRFTSNDSDVMVDVFAGNANDARLKLTADNSDDAGDEWTLTSLAANAFTIGNDSASSGTDVTKLTITTAGIITTVNDLHVSNDSGTTAAVSDLLRIESTTTGTSAAGIGVGLEFWVEDASASEQQGSIDVALTDVTNGSEDADMIFSVNTAGAIAEVGRFVAAASATTGDSFTVTGNTTETNAVLDVLTLTNATGTAANNSGIGISFAPEDATGAEQQARIHIIQTTAARATNDTDFVFTQNVNGTLTERVRFDADGPNVRVGAGAAADQIVGFDGAAVDFYVGIDDTDDDLNIGLGLVPGVTNRIAIAGDSETITLGAGTGDVDTTLVFDGTAQNYYIGIDDTDDELDFGLGVAPGTTVAFSIDANRDIHFLEDIVIAKTLNYATDTASDDTYLIAFHDAPAAYTLGMMIIFRAVTQNTGACTVNVNSLGAKDLLTLNDVTPPNDYIEAGSMVMALYNGTAFEIVTPDANP